MPVENSVCALPLPLALLALPLDLRRENKPKYKKMRDHANIIIRGMMVPTTVNRSSLTFRCFERGGARRCGILQMVGQAHRITAFARGHERFQRPAQNKCKKVNKVTASMQRLRKCNLKIHSAGIHLHV